MMTKNSCALILAAALIAATLPAAARAQVQTTAPIIVKQPKHKFEKFKGSVLSATGVAIMLQSVDNDKLVRTFQYSPKMQDKMRQIIDQGGYQYGDKVTIVTEPGSDVAVAIKGKPSKSQ